MSASALPLGPGIHAGISSDVYHADPCAAPSLSNSLLTTLLQKTPRHAWLSHPRLNPEWEREESAAKYDLGTATHCLLLEGVDAVSIVAADDWRTNAAKAARDKARAEGKIPMLADQARAVIQMIDACKAFVASTSLGGIFERGKPEQTIVAKVGGVLVRARPDWLLDDHSVILDYKSTGAEGPDEWMRRNLVQHGYDTQADLYARALAAVTGRPRARFMFLVQETVAPFMCYLVEPAESMKELAASKVNRGLQVWKDCLARNFWPGYSTDVYQAEAPIWAMKDEEAIA